MPIPFSPHSLFSAESIVGNETPRAFTSPHWYIQGNRVIDRVGQYLSILSSRQPAVLITRGGWNRLGSRILKSLCDVGIDPIFEIFGGECSHEEVNRLAHVIRGSGKPIDSVIAVGGGKCADAGKCVASRLSVPVVICPTIASTDAPCSATSVMYTNDGAGMGPEFFPSNPALVLVDSGIIADSPVRHLVAGIGDAIATFYEARTCYRNPAGRNMLGARITLAALAIAELCAKTVIEEARAAMEAVQRHEVNAALERVIEANTLLSGVGFESGGLAAAHAMAAGMTVIPLLHRDYLHGELVAIGLIAHLVLEGESLEARRIARFLTEVGLPVSLRQLQMQRDRDSVILMDAMRAAVKEPFAHNEPFEVTPEKLYSALLEADAIGAEIMAAAGK